jgi:hypothetical protein
MSNATITYPVMSRPWKDLFDKDYLTEGAPLFVFRDQQHAVRNHGRPSHPLQTVASLAMINTKFAASAKLNYARFTDKLSAGDDGKDVVFRTLNAGVKGGLAHRDVLKSFSGVFEGDADPDAKHTIMYANGFLGSWSFLGILRNESNPRSRFQRMLNLDVRGRSRVRNIWGAVRGGDRLYLRLVRGKNAMYRERTPKEGLGLSPRAAEHGWFMIPEMNPACKGNSCCLIPIGTVTNGVHRLASDGARKRALHKKGSAVELDFIEIALGISCE